MYDHLSDTDQALNRIADALWAIEEHLNTAIHTTPEGCGHENWHPFTAMGQTEQHFMCLEPGCGATKTEPWE